MASGLKESLSSLGWGLSASLGSGLSAFDSIWDCSPVLAPLTRGNCCNAGKTTPRLTIPARVQVPVCEEQVARSLLRLEGLRVARKCAGIRDFLRGWGRGLLFGQMVSKDIADRDVILL